MGGKVNVAMNERNLKNETLRRKTNDYKKIIHSYEESVKTSFCEVIFLWARMPVIAMGIFSLTQLIRFCHYY